MTTSILRLIFVFVLPLLDDVVVETQTIDEFPCIKLKSGRNGTCIVIDKCERAIAELKNKEIPETCGFRGKTPMVCCEGGAPSDAHGALKPISVQKCEEYARRTITPPEQVPKIVGIGGVEALLLEFPHMAILGYGSFDNIKWQCGGSLISETYILTAAHCLKSKFGDVSYVRLGAHSLDGLTPFVQNFTVKKTYPHPEYVATSHYHDIALIELDKPVLLQQKVGVKPACLHTRRRLDVDGPLVGSGWGATELYGGLSNVLRKFALRSVRHENCSRFYQPQNKLKQGLMDDWQFCADGGGKRVDTCQGDSGGPLQDPKSTYGLFTVVGITSFGIKCAIVPAVYTRVSHYVPWIESIVWPE